MSYFERRAPVLAWAAAAMFLCLGVTSVVMSLISTPRWEFALLYLGAAVFWGVAGLWAHRTLRKL